MKKKVEVGRRNYHGKKMKKPRLVIATITKDDAEQIERLKEAYGHNSRAGAIRFSLRKMSSVQRGDKVAEELAIEVRRESCYDTKDEYPDHDVRVPVNLHASDNDVMETLKSRFELDSFAQVVRLAIRHTEQMEVAHG